MSSEIFEQKDFIDLAQKVAVLEERMETMNERYDKNLALLREDLAKREVESSKRELRIILTIIGLFVVGISVQLYLGS